MRYTEGTVSAVTPIVKDSKEFMKSRETRDTLQLLFLPNFEALKTVFGGQSVPKDDFDEALIDL